MQVFVIGAPRSGTTLIGRYIASHPDCLDLGEYYAFYLTFLQVPRTMARMPTPYRDRYISESQRLAIAFAENARKGASVKFFCDQTPWNIFVAQHLSAAFPAALFVLTLRHYSGTIQSLERSWNDGYAWAGSNTVERSRVWASFYSNASKLPASRTIPISYDALCADPEAVSKYLVMEISNRLGIDHSKFDPTTLSQSHATTSVRPTIAFLSGKNLIFSRISSYSQCHWTAQHQAVVQPEVSTVNEMLGDLYGPAYASPYALEH